MLKKRIIFIGWLLFLTHVGFLSCQKAKIIEDDLGVYQVQLKNGLTVLIQENHATPVVTVLTRVKTGYFQEPDTWTGIAHLLEHMFFKGTEKRPDPNQMHEEARAYGGTLNAWTYYDSTGYHITLPSSYFEHALELQADGISNMRIDPTELAKEAEVVIQEGKRKKDNPGQLTQELLNGIAFEKHPLKRWRIGSEKGLRNLTRNDVLNFYKKYYTPQNLILTIVGDVHAKEALKSIQKYFGEISQTPIPQIVQEPDTQPEPDQTEFRYQRRWADVHTSYVSMGFHAPKIFHEDMYALEMIAGILGTGQSSRLYQSLIQEKNIANRVDVELENFSDIGFFTLQLNLPAAQILNAQMTVIKELETLKHVPVTEDELEKIRNQIKTRYFLDQESTLGMAQKLSYFEQYGDHKQLKTYLSKLYAVTPQDIQRVARIYFNIERLSIFEYVARGQNTHHESKKYLSQKLLDTQKFYAHQLSKQKDPRFRGDDKQLTSLFKTEALPKKGEISPLKRYELSNKATLLLQEDHNLPLITLHLYFKGGRLHENKNTSGLTQLLLKSSLKGTTTKTAHMISQRLDYLGAKVETECNLDYFGYRLTVLQENFHEAL